MAYGKIKADAVIWDNSGSDVEESMSTIAGKLNASGGAMTGNLTLNAQNELRLADSDSSNYIAFASPATVGTNSTWSMPSDAPVAGDVLTVTSVSSNNPALEWAPASGGKILQVVHAIKTDVFSTSSAQTTPVAVTGLSASITPTTSGNKVLVMYNCHVSNTQNNYGSFTYLYKDSSQVTDIIGDTNGSNTRSATYTRVTNNYDQSHVAVTYLDTTSGTSSITYQVYACSESGGTVWINTHGAGTSHAYYGNTSSSITLMEVAQ